MAQHRQAQRTHGRHRAQAQRTHHARTILLCIGAFVGLMWVIGHAQQTQAPAMATDTLYMCTSEDGSDPGQAFPCLWDAQAQGNGQGTSYVLTVDHAFTLAEVGR